MNCEKCGIQLQEGQSYTFEGKTLCEDCCFDLMNPPKVCDPTAVSQTLMIRKQLGQTGTEGLSELQKKIYTTVAEKGKISRVELMGQLNLTDKELEKEFAVLRHCELLRGFKEGNTVYITKFKD